MEDFVKKKKRGKWKILWKKLAQILFLEKFNKEKKDLWKNKWNTEE